MISLADRIEQIVLDIMADNISLRAGIKKIRRLIGRGLTPQEWRKA